MSDHARFTPPPVLCDNIIRSRLQLPGGAPALAGRSGAAGRRAGAAAAASAAAGRGRAGAGVARGGGAGGVGQDGLGGVLGGDHDDGLGVTGGQVGVHGGVDDVDVVGAPDFGVGVDDGGAVVGGAHAGGADKVRAGGHVVLGDEGLGGRVEREGGVGAVDHLQELVHELGDGALVARAGQVGLLGDLGRAGGGDAQGAGGGDAVRQVDLHLDGVGRGGVDGALDVVGRTVVGLDCGPDVDTLATLGEQTLGLGVELGGDSGVGGGEGGLGQGGQAVLDLQADGEDGVVHQVLADGQLDPVSLLGQGDLDGAALNSLDLRLGADTRVDQHAGGGQSTTGQDDLAAGGEVDDLAVAVGQLDLDTGGSGALADNTDELGVQGQLEVVLGLGEGKVRADGAATETVLNQPRRVGEDLLLVIGVLESVGVRPALLLEEAGHDSEGVHVDTGAVLEDVTRGALVERVSGSGDVRPLPSRGPLVVEVVSRGLNEHQSVDHGGTTEDAAGHGSGVETVLGGVTGLAEVVSHGGNIVLGDGVVVRDGSITTSRVGGGSTTLKEEDRGAGLNETLRDNQASSTATSNNVIISGVAGGCGNVLSAATSGRVARTAGGRAAGSRGGQSSPGRVVGRLGISQAVAVLTEGSTVVVQGSRGIAGVSQGSLGESVSEDISLGVDSERFAIVSDTALAKEGVLPAGGVDGGTLGNLVHAHGAVGDRAGVGVARGLAQGTDHLVTIGPSSDEQCVGHGSAQGDGSVAVDCVGLQDTDEVTARLGGLGKSQTETPARLLVVRELDAGLVIGICGGLLTQNASGHGGRSQ